MSQSFRGLHPPQAAFITLDHEPQLAHNNFLAPFTSRKDVYYYISRSWPSFAKSFEGHIRNTIHLRWGLRSNTTSTEFRSPVLTRAS
ncbi:MAG: hypothetical protein ACTS6G_02770 [Candidatus Hodgkinia cicadicola]